MQIRLIIGNGNGDNQNEVKLGNDHDLISLLN